jgi:hypothetical protein
MTERNDYLLVGIVLIILTLWLGITAHCQTLPLGTVQVNGSASCAGFQAKATCVSLTIQNCPGPEINVTLGTTSGPLGMVVFANGSFGSLPGGATYLNPLRELGYSTAAFAWPSTGWQDGVGNLIQAACRPATLFNYIANGGSIFVIAASGGAGAAAFCISWYQGCPIVNNAFTSGPVYSNVGLGCEMPKAANATIYPSDGDSWSGTLYYNAGVPSNMTEFTGLPCQQKGGTSQSDYDSWLDNDSILAPGAVFPYIPVYAQLCATSQEENNSAAQAYLWLSQMGAWIVAMNGCQGSENTTLALTPDSPPLTGTQALLNYVEENY